MVLVLALALTIIMPATATAKGLEPFNAFGTVYGIEQGDIKEAGKSGRWVVSERNLYGGFGFFGDSPVQYGFTLKYHANIDSVYTQAGNLHGVLSIYETPYTLNVTGSTDPAYPDPVDPSGNPVPYFADITIPDVGYFPNMLVANYILHLDGTWTFISGAVGNGTFEGEVAVQICVDNELTNPIYAALFQGHIVGFLPDDSSFTLDGHWKP
jgi:hypothetical protein